MYLFSLIKAMAVNYDAWKKGYESLNDQEKQQYWERVKSLADDNVYNQYYKQYQQAQTSNTPQSNTNSSNFTTPSGTNWQNTTQTTATTTPKSTNQTPKYDPNETLDTNMFWASNGKVVVKEGTAQQTGKPDYTLDTDARMKEITDNLNAYWQTNREYFTDRATYNQMFHYNDRNDQQKALLDSYWKKKEDMDVAVKYTSWDALADWMGKAEITPDQLNYIKDYSPEAYRERQQKQQDEINLRIANMATPADPTDNAELFASLAEKLNLEPWDPYQIYDNWYDMCERLGVFSDSQQLKSYQNQLNDNHRAMEGIMNRYAANTGGTQSDALAAARMQKALAPYQQLEVDLQNSYTALLNGRNSNLAVANQSANALAMQAAEDQRIFNQRLSGLGFAMQTASYRSPEQQAQLQLQTQQIQSDMSLLTQSMQNDLNLYNQYQTVKLENQLQQELTDLSVTDEQQLKANLYNALTPYYEQYGDIIQRSQQQAVDDIIAYAKENKITVAQALTKNFLTPLQWKSEYKMAMRERYGLNKYQQEYAYTIDENGNVVIKATGYGEIPQEAFKTRASRQEAYEDVYETSGSWADYIENLAWAIKDGSYGGQCGAFCNDVLLAWDNSKVFGNSLQDKIKACNVSKEEWPQVWYAAVFDLWFTSSDWINHWHVGFVAAVNGDWSIDVLESNGKSDETIHIKRYSKTAVDQMVKWYYKPNGYDVQKEAASYSNSYQEASTDTPYAWISNVTSTGAEINSGGWITDLEDTFLSSTRMSDSERKELYAAYGIDTKQYNAMKKKYVDYQAKVSLIEDTQKMYDAVQDLLTWNQNHQWKHTWRVDTATYEAIENGTPIQNERRSLWLRQKWNSETANGINKYNYVKKNQLLERFQELKKAGATFWAMSNSEWNIVWAAASKLNWQTSDSEFEAILKQMLNSYGNILADAGVEWFYNTDI